VVTGANFGATTSRGFTQAQLASTASYQAKNLQRIGLYSNDLTGWDFSGQNLTVAVFYHSTLTKANLTGADTRGAQGLDLTGSTSRNAIRPDGNIAGLNLDVSERLLIRDYDGDPCFCALLPPIPIVIQSHMTMRDGGTLQMYFDADAWNSTISFQPDIPVALGGTLELLFAPDVDSASQVGRMFDVFDWTGVEPTGAFTVTSPYLWDLGNLYSTGEVRLTGTEGPADYDHSGLVDQGDLDLVLLTWGNELTDPASVGWTNDLPIGPVDQNELDKVLLNWGSQVGTQLASPTIPEPSTGAVVVIFGTAAWICGSRRRRSWDRRA
jgi:hypothetical protein